MTDPVGLRERKRAETYARIQVNAMRIFLKRGFDVATLDDIAAAADVSRRTLLNYFQSKEEIVFSTKGNFPALVAEAIARRPEDESLLDMVENALVELARSYQSKQTRNSARLVLETPALNAGDQAKYEKVERALAEALADRKNLHETDTVCRVMAAMAIGILKLAVLAWVTEDVSLEVQIKTFFFALRRITG